MIAAKDKGIAPLREQLASTEKTQSIAKQVRKALRKDDDPSGKGPWPTKGPMTGKGGSKSAKDSSAGSSSNAQSARRGRGKEGSKGKSRGRGGAQR